jgi:hypothetical protein
MGHPWELQVDLSSPAHCVFTIRFVPEQSRAQLEVGVRSGMLGLAVAPLRFEGGKLMTPVLSFNSISDSLRSVLGETV